MEFHRGGIWPLEFLKFLLARDKMQLERPTLTQASRFKQL